MDQDQKPEEKQAEQDQQLKEQQVEQGQQPEVLMFEQDQQPEGQQVWLEEQTEQTVQEQPPQNTSVVSQVVQDTGSENESFFQNLSGLVENLGNDFKAFLQQQSLDAIAEFLGISGPSVFDDCINSQESCVSKIVEVLHDKKKQMEFTVYGVMKSYDDLNLQGNLNSLEKIMRILKSKEKLIYIKKDPIKARCCEHCGHEKQKYVLKEGQWIPEEEADQQNKEKQTEECQQQIEGENQEKSEEQQKGEQKEQKEQKEEEQNEQKEGEQQEPQQEKQQEGEQQKEQVQENPEQQILKEEPQSLPQQQQVNQIKEQEEQQEYLIIKNNPLEKLIQLEQFLSMPKQEEEQQDKLSQMTCSDLFGIMSLKTLNLTQLENINSEENSLVFKLHEQYKIEIRGSVKQEQKKFINEDSIFSKLPQSIVTYNIFPFFSALELFKLRIICGEWKDGVRQTWHIIFKREMFEQLLAKDLYKDMIQHTKLLLIRTPFLHKIGILIKAMTELIDWQSIIIKTQDKTLDVSIKMLIISILKLLGKDVTIQYLSDFDDVIWEMNRKYVDNLKELINDIHSQEHLFPSKSQLYQVKIHFLKNPSLDLHYMFNIDDKNALYLSILVNQLYFYELLKTQLFAQQLYINHIQIELDILQKRQSPNKDFLEGAYKMLLLKTSVLKNGKVESSNYDQDEEDDQEDEDEESANGTEANQFINALTNINPLQLRVNEPDIVIKKKKNITKIFIDVNTKIDILLTSMQLCDQQKDQEQQGQQENKQKENEQQQEQPQEEQNDKQQEQPQDQEQKQQQEQLQEQSQSESHQDKEQQTDL